MPKQVFALFSFSSLFHISLENRSMDLVHSKVSTAFGVRVSAALSLDPSLHSACTWLLYLADLCLADATYRPERGPEGPSLGSCPNLSPLIGPAQISLPRHCRTAPSLVGLPCLTVRARVHVSVHEVGNLTLLFFSFCLVGFFFFC